MASDGARKQFWKRSNSKVPGSRCVTLASCGLIAGCAAVGATEGVAKWALCQAPPWLIHPSVQQVPYGGRGPPLEVLGCSLLLQTASSTYTAPSTPPLTPCSTARSASDTVPLQRSQSLPHSASGALGGAAEPGTCSGGGAALSEREASRLDKFRQLLAGPHTDLGALRSRGLVGLAIGTLDWGSGAGDEGGDGYRVDGRCVRHPAGATRMTGLPPPPWPRGGGGWGLVPYPAVPLPVEAPSVVSPPGASSGSGGWAREKGHVRFLEVPSAVSLLL
ncbi:hypothetical protein CB1_000279030 [Camelus ferus]|nr:hypothetical protein CB1_000279030 [Camelus ferus]